MIKNSSESYKVYTEEKSGDCTSGVIETQPETRKALPAASAVTDAKAEPGTAKKCADKQVGENRQPMNSYVKECQEHGSNN